MELNADGTLSLPASPLTTGEVDQLLHDLALVRSAMQPPVPIDFDPEAPRANQHNPMVVIGKQEDGSLFIGLRHCGFGWVSFTVDSHLAASIARRLQTAGAVGPFLDDSDAGTDRMH